MSSYFLLWKYIKQYPILIVVNIILGFSSALFNGVSLALVIPLISLFLQEDNQSSFSNSGPPILKRLFQLFDVFPEQNRLPIMVGSVIALIIFKNLTNYISNLVSLHLSRTLVNRVRLEGLDLLLQIDLDFFNKNKIGDIVNRISNEVGRTASAVQTLISLVSQIITITIFVIFLISLSWQLTIIAVFLLVLVGIFNQVFITRSKYYGKLLSEKSKVYSNKLMEILTGIRLIKSVSMEETEYQLIKDHIVERERAEFWASANLSAISPLNEISGILTIVGIVVLARLFLENQISNFNTTIITFLVFLFRLLPQVGQLNSIRSKLANLSYSILITREFLDRSTKPFMKRGTKLYDYLKKQIRFENVSFNYPNQENQVLKNISLTINKGETLALVGSSGSGKSTIADLLARFYDPTVGAIFLDDNNLQDYDLSSFHRQISIVSQDTFLFNNTVKYNITYGCKNVTEAELIQASKRANAYEFIINLPQGFETEIGDRGVMLSGGQRQRIAIARALLRNPDILILDEATSALDTVSERLVQLAIEELCKNRTTLVIAHRLSTIQRADQIVVLDQGKLLEKGTHKQLLESNGFYTKLYQMQFSDDSPSKTFLPTNSSFIRASLQASQELRNVLSYEIRTRLNDLLGSLRLVNDGLVDNEKEREELIEESYQSAILLLNTMEKFEKARSVSMESSPERVK